MVDARSWISFHPTSAVTQNLKNSLCWLAVSVRSNTRRARLRASELDQVNQQDSAEKPRRSEGGPKNAWLLVGDCKILFLRVALLLLRRDSSFTPEQIFGEKTEAKLSGRSL